MLVVTRKKDEKLIIGDGIEVQVLRIGRENVRLGIKAPSDVSIYRQEIYDAIQNREKAAARAAGAGAEVTPGSETAGEPSGEAGEPSPRPSDTKARTQSEGK
jgi:carbon storage regulator